ncbi:MAG TPA: hypothetical protein PKC76_12015 [Saprospiraceae bacterium]|nr:hypothetical protein [Saprospiraceae bacterium]HMP24854.1 hypothetical protein [Saprospiraceae bacterium]
MTFASTSLYRIRVGRAKPVGKPAVFRDFLLEEAKALRVRLQQVKPFAMTIPMVHSAHLPPAAQAGIDDLLLQAKRELKEKIRLFIRLLEEKDDINPEEAQKTFALLKLRFNALLDKLDIFADVITQRSEHFFGVWLSGLDILAQDALNIRGDYFQPPPMVCYLDRGHGAAIRRARTRLPGGKSNPVAVIRVPRERMISHGIASSLIHEVGHQGAALLDLLPPLRIALRGKAAADSPRRQAWEMFERWISEILADFWAVATVGVSASTGLMGVLSLPHYFVFRIGIEGPHPFPWIRAKISLAFGKALYPDPQWERLEELWNRLYPTGKLPEVKQELLRQLEDTLPDFVRLVTRYRPARLRGRTLASIFPVKTRQPAQLRRTYLYWKKHPSAMRRARPALIFAVLGQARADHRITPERESALLRGMLVNWAMRM